MANTDSKITEKTNSENTTGEKNLFSADNPNAFLFDESSMNTSKKKPHAVFESKDSSHSHHREHSHHDARTDSGEDPVSDEGSNAFVETEEEKEDTRSFEAIEETDTDEETQEDEKTRILKELFGIELTEEQKNEIFSDTVPSEEKVKEIFADDNIVAEVKKENDEYIAMDDSETEGTKEYSPDFSSLEEALKNYVPEDEDDHDVVVNEEKVNGIDNPYNMVYDGDDDEPKRERTLLPEEFTSYEQYDEFAENLRNRSFRSIISSIWGFFLFLALLYLESTSFSKLYHPELLRPDGAFSLVYLLVDIQLIFFSSLLMFKNISNGIKGFFAFKPTRDTVFSTVAFLAVAQDIAYIFIKPDKMILFGSVVALFSFFTALANSLEAKRIYRSFRIFASQKQKMVASKVSSDSAENDAFSEYLNENSKIFTVEKSNFIDDFFAKANKRPESDSSYGIVLLISFIASVLFVGLCYYKGASIPELIAAFVGMSMMTLPLASLFSSIVPFANITKKAYKNEAAIASLDAADYYGSADVVSFLDSEIFPPKYVKISTVRTYGSTRIDMAILYAAQIFKKLGGPLSQVFKKMVAGAYQDISEDFDFLEITADGMCAKIDDREIFVGNKDYMSFYDFGYTKDESDEKFEANQGRIMYMVIGANLAAKFYIRYPISTRFEKTLENLCKIGVCGAVKTCDPNVDTDLLMTSVKKEKITAEVIKTTDAMKDSPVREKSSSGIVCTSSIANMLKTFIMCESLSRLIKTNFFMKLLSVIIGVGITVFLFFINHFINITPLFIIAYDLIWLVPIFFTSLAE